MAGTWRNSGSSSCRQSAGQLTDLASGSHGKGAPTTDSFGDDQGMSEVEVVRSHHERVTVRVGDVFVKVNSEDWRTRREVAALEHVDVPTPAVLWAQSNVVALSALGGTPLALAGEDSTAPPAAWRAAGAMARRLHAHALPPWNGRGWEEYRDHLDLETRRLIDMGVVEEADVRAVRAQAEAVLRPFVPAFIHADLQAAHVFVDGDEVVGVIDWEDAEAGDPLLDLAVLTMGHREHLDEVLDGYAEPVDLDILRGWWAFRRITALCWWIGHGFDASGDIAAFRRHARSL
jgi:aminoglycoside phosphotransferase (APT) family kinase protein